MGKKLRVQLMRQELTDGQRVLMGDLLPVQTFSPPPQEPVQVHVHVGSNANTATSGFSWLGLIGAVTVGVLAYSLYQGQPVSVTVGRIESAITTAATPQWLDGMKAWWAEKTAPVAEKPASSVAEARTSVP